LVTPILEAPIEAEAEAATAMDMSAEEYQLGVEHDNDMEAMSIDGEDEVLQAPLARDRQYKMLMNAFGQPQVSIK
jgi:hypothetical protein